MVISQYATLAVHETFTTLEHEDVITNALHRRAYTKTRTQRWPHHRMLLDILQYCISMWHRNHHDTRAMFASTHLSIFYQLTAFARQCNAGETNGVERLLAVSVRVGLGSIAPVSNVSTSWAP